MSMVGTLSSPTDARYSPMTPPAHLHHQRRKQARS